MVCIAYRFNNRNMFINNICMLFNSVLHMHIVDIEKRKYDF